MGAAAALERARQDIAAGKRRYPSKANGNWGEDRAYYADEWPTGWRVVGRADEVCRREGSRRVDHRGWYTVDDGWDNNTLAGYVLLLPHGRFIPGSKDWGGVTLYPTETYDDPVDCAAAADRHAEIAAEKERDYQRARDAGREAGEANEQARAIRREVLSILNDLRAARARLSHKSEAVERLCGLARKRVGEMVEEIYELRRKRDELRDECPRALMGAFEEGYQNV